MEKDIQNLIIELQMENKHKNKQMSLDSCDEYNHTVLVHTYNCNLRVINELKNIIKN